MEVLNHQLAVFFLMILAGYLAYSCRLLTEELHDRLNTILMRLIIPALLVSNMALGGGRENLRLLLPMLAGGLCIFGFLYLCGCLTAFLLRQKGDLRKVQIGITTFGSTGFFGIPLAAQVLGPVGTAAFGIYSIVDNVMVWTLGLSLSTGSREEEFGLSPECVKTLPAGGKPSGGKVKSPPQGLHALHRGLRRLAQPATIAVLAGLVLFALEIPKDLLVLEVLGRIGDCSNPLAMICIGASIARSDIRRIYKGWLSFTVVIVKMLLCPVTVYAGATALGVYEPAVISLTFAAAIPASSMFSIMCKENGNQEADYATRASIITVICSMVTIPLVVSIINGM